MRKKSGVRQSEVMSVLVENPKPMTAYEILDRMKLDEHDLAAWRLVKMG